MKKHEELNNLFTSGDINSIYGKYGNEENLNIDFAITNIIKALNETYYTRKKNNDNYEYNYKAL